MGDSQTISVSAARKDQSGGTNKFASLMNNGLGFLNFAGNTNISSIGSRGAEWKLSIKGDATHAYIAAGSGMDAPFNSGQPLILTTFNADAGIGSVKIGGNFNTSNIFAGVDDGGSPGVNPINSGDTLGVGNAALTAKLGPVVIKGHLLSERDSFYFAGFTADVIASITVPTTNGVVRAVGWYT